ncbi:MAG: hypothetical protein IKR68_09560 [Lachnospiraceae bacterium]|nr:hypothetical protein [Lachnospiraceae bacterium]
MTSKIEDTINQIAEYIETCKYLPFSNNMIKVDRDVMEGLLDELRKATPDEIKRYQKIISNKEAIMADAEQKAKNLVDKANQFINSSVNDHEIVQQAYVQAGDIIQDATDKAQDILDQATIDANNIRLSAIDYTDDSLANVEGILSTAIETAQARNDALITNLQQYLQKISADRAELRADQEEVTGDTDRSGQGAGDGGSIDVMVGSGND